MITKGFRTAKGTATAGTTTLEQQVAAEIQRQLSARLAELGVNSIEELKHLILESSQSPSMYVNSSNPGYTESPGYLISPEQRKFADDLKRSRDNFRASQIAT